MKTQHSSHFYVSYQFTAADPVCVTKTNTTCMYVCAYVCVKLYYINANSTKY